MRRKRRLHKPEFKAKVALSAVKGEMTMAEMVKKFDVQAAQITQWKKQLWKWKSTHQLTYDELPSKKVSLYDIQIVEYKEYNGGDFFNECIHRVDSVDKSYSFRQM